MKPLRRKRRGIKPEEIKAGSMCVLGNAIFPKAASLLFHRSIRTPFNYNP